MKTRMSLKTRQGGAVAVIVGFSLVLLVGFLAMVIDLGHLYIAKTELQNAADAAALAGAKDLDGTVDGVNNAIASAGRFANKNNYDFSSKPVVSDANLTNPTAEIDISVGTCPDPRPVAAGGCMVSVTAGSVTAAQAAGATFLMVHTRNRDMVAWFAPVWNIFHVSTYGMAVAGKYALDVAPIGVCAVDKTRPERGFIRGVAYNVPQLNPLIINADPMWINPVIAPPVGDCNAEVDPQWNSRNKMAPFICTGKSFVIKNLPGQVFVNTGKETALSKEINSRFDDFQGSLCNVATAPPDANVKKYRADDPTKPPPERLPPAPAACPQGSSNPNCGYPRDWMEPGASGIPSQQGITISNRAPIDKTISGAARTPPVSAQFKDYGVLWSYSREKNFGTGQNHTLDDWCGETDPLLPCSTTSLYKGRADQTANGYPPTTPATPYPSPYAQGPGSKYFSPPPNNPTAGVVGRRLLNLVIIDCSVPEVAQVGPGNKCAALPTLAVGEFFMPVPADLPKDELYLEFSRLVAPPLPPAEIRLYR